MILMNTYSSATIGHFGLSHMRRNRACSGISIALILAVLVVFGALRTGDANAAQLRAGVAKVDVTDTEAGPVNDRLHVKALVLKDGTTTTAIVTVDAVAIGEIGPIRNDYLANVRSRIEKELNIKPVNVLINASHCHGVVCSDVDQRLRINILLSLATPMAISTMHPRRNSYIMWAGLRRIATVF